MSIERRKLNRRNFSYYMRVMNEATGELVGHLSDISTGGFKLDSRQTIPLNRDFTLRVDLTNEVANKTFMVFVARSRWCQPDHYDPSTYNIGFQIINMTPGDLDIFTRMFEKYGSNNKNSNLDYLWK
ncbi:MAG: PilZ domain-containing protein [Chloroflexi bacterium]|nr:PilZ domain-containing protein [Chloroflexota bacterium]